MRKSIRKGLRIYLQKKLVSLLFKIKRNRILFLEIDILKMKNAYDIMPLGKRRNVFIVTQQKPRRRKLRGFFPFWRGGLVPRLTTSCLFSIQPFANVVGDYTCQNRKHKRRNYIHNNAPPFRTCIRGGSLAIVS